MFLENIKEAVTSIFSNKMRSILTMLGIIIGISAVITITTIGNSIQTTLTSTLNSLGGNTVQAYVDARYPEDDADWETWEYPDMKTSDFVTQEMIDELLEKYPDEFNGVAASEFLGNGQIRQDKNTYANVSIQGTKNACRKKLNEAGWQRQKECLPCGRHDGRTVFWRGKSNRKADHIYRK